MPSRNRQKISTRSFEGVGKQSRRSASSNSYEQAKIRGVIIEHLNVLDFHTSLGESLTSISNEGSLNGFWKIWQKCATQGTSHQLLMPALCGKAPSKGNTTPQLAHNACRSQSMTFIACSPVRAYTIGRPSRSRKSAWTFPLVSYSSSPSI